MILKPAIHSIRSRAAFAAAMAFLAMALLPPPARAQGIEGRDVLLSAP